MNKSHFRICLLTGLFSFVAINAAVGEVKESTLTVDQFVQRVLETNPERRFYEQEIAAAKANREASTLLKNPDLELSVGRSNDSARAGTAWSVSVTQSFEFPGRLSLRKAIAGKELRLAELGYERFKTDLAAKARLTAHEALIAQQIAKAANNAAVQGQGLLHTLVQRESTGINPLLETRIIEASVVSLQKKALEAEQNAQDRILSLNQLSGDPFSNTLKVVPTEIKLGPVPNTQELVTSAMESNFELLSRIEELKAQGFRVGLAKNERYPSISVGPFYSRERYSDKEEVIGIGVSVPLPLWNKNTEVISAAQSREEQGKTVLLLAQREVEKKVISAAANYEKTYHVMQSWRPTLLADMKEASELADKHYRLGAVPVATYVELQRQYVEGLESVLSTQKDALEHLQELETLTGQTFKKSFVTESASEEAKK